MDTHVVSHVGSRPQKLENPKGHRIQEFSVNSDRLRLDAIYPVAFLGEQAVPTDYGRDRRSLETHAVDALRQHSVIQPGAASTFLPAQSLT